MKNVKFAFVAFFEVFPVTFGSSVVCGSLFNHWPHKKKYFQLSNKKNLPSVVNTFYFKNPLGKLFAIPLLFINLKKYLNSKNNYIIIEGASWIGFSYILILLSKIFLRNTKIIYKSHSIEYEIRKNNNNFLISKITKFLERKVLLISDLSTSVSTLEQKKFFKYYKIKTFLFFNTIEFLNKKIQNVINETYIIFSGSYDYKPNSYSINQLVRHIMPKLIKKKINVKLYILGNKSLKYKRYWLKTHFSSKKNYLKFLKNSLALVVPSNESYGSKIKIIEALCYGVPVITSKIGLTGITRINKYQPLISKDNNNSIVKLVEQIYNNKKFYSLKAEKNKQEYIKRYDIKHNLNRLKNKIKSI